MRNKINMYKSGLISKIDVFGDDEKIIWFNWLSSERSELRYRGEGGGKFCCLSAISSQGAALGRVLDI